MFILIYFWIYQIKKFQYELFVKDIEFEFEVGNYVLRDHELSSLHDWEVLSPKGHQNIGRLKGGYHEFSRVLIVIDRTLYQA